MYQYIKGILLEYALYCFEVEKNKKNIGLIWIIFV